MRFFLKTFGCTLNQADGDAMRALLLESGATEAETEEGADVVILNTCTVKRATEQKTVLKLQQLAKTGKPLVVAGCIPSANPRLVSKTAPRASLVSTGMVSHIADAAAKTLKGERVVFTGFEGKEKLPFTPSGAIARIAACEGCLSSCSFCQTKLARPRLASLSISCILDRIRLAASKGAVEIQLTGQDLGAYGKDLKTNLTELLSAISSEFLDLTSFRIRIGMLNPEHALEMPELPRLLAKPPFYKFLHLPLQSASDFVLRGMNRKYSVEEYARVASLFRKTIPDLTLSTDIICGFPTESEEDFQQTLGFMQKTRFDITNISRFTPRPFTQANSFPQLSNELINARTRKASALAKKISLEKNTEWIGRRVSALVTEILRTPVGRTETYKPIALPGASLGQLIEAKVTGASFSCLKGTRC